MQNRKSGFTLIELLVVLALIAIISSITFGAFRSISDGNKRTSCQSNLSQIYKSARLYAQDFDGKYPYLNPLKNPPVANPTATDYVAEDQPATPKGGIGLWGLYTFRIAGGDTICPNNDVNLPFADDGAQAGLSGAQVGLSGYVRSSKIFHCPADRFEKVVQYRVNPGDAACAVTPQAVNNAQFTFVYIDNGKTLRRLNPSYLSYQTNDDTIITPSAEPHMTYSSFRQSDLPKRVRQLTAFETNANINTTPERPTDQATVITWCRFHRSLKIDTDSNGVTVPNGRNFDNVLFSDGSVQSLPVKQTVTDTNGNTHDCTGWQRVRREKADSMKSAVDCTP